MLRLTFCHNSSRRLTDNLPALQQAGWEAQQFWRLVRKCCSELRLSSPPGCRNVSRCKRPHHGASRPGGEISARHATLPRELIRPCDTLALPSHWPADHVTGSDWWRVTSDQLHQIWPGCCSWGQQQHTMLSTPRKIHSRIGCVLRLPHHIWHTHNCQKWWNFLSWQQWSKGTHHVVHKVHKLMTGVLNPPSQVPIGAAPKTARWTFCCQVAPII